MRRTAFSQGVVFTSRIILSIPLNPVNVAKAIALR